MERYAHTVIHNYRRTKSWTDGGKERCTEGQMYRQIGHRKDGQTDRQIWQTDRQIGQTDRQIDRQTNWWKDGQMDRLIDRHTGRWTDRQTKLQIDRQTACTSTLLADCSSFYLSFQMFICLSICPSVYLQVGLSFYLSTCLSVPLACASLCTESNS